MKKPTKKEITKFLKENYPFIEFDGITFDENEKEGYCWFKIISFGRVIGQADYFLNENYWEKVKNHLNWVFKN